MLADANTLIEWTILPGTTAELGESPVWDEQRQCVWWVDIDGRKLLRTSYPAMATEEWPMPERPGFVVLTDANLPAVGMETGIFLFDPSEKILDRITQLDEPGMRFNDATVDDFGRLWAGTMDMELKAGRGVLSAIGANCRPEIALEGLQIPNGLAFDGGRKRLYLSDSGNDIRTVWTFQVEPESHQLHNREVFAVFGDEDGKPDGAAIDESGNYWSAAILGGALRVFSPDGERIMACPMPFADPTKPAFAGGSLDRIFVTSRRRVLSD